MISLNHVLAILLPLNNFECQGGTFGAVLANEIQGIIYREGCSAQIKRQCLIRRKPLS